MVCLKMESVATAQELSDLKTGDEINVNVGLFPHRLHSTSLQDKTPATTNEQDIQAIGMCDLPKQVKSIRIKRKVLPASDTSPSKKSRVYDDSMEYTEVLDDTCLDSDESNEGNKATTKDIDITAPTIQFTLSTGGASLQAILNRYMYFLFSSAHVAGVRKWRCVDYKVNKYRKASEKCPAFIVTRGNIVTYRTNPHNHGYHDKKILRKVQLNQVFSAIEDVPVSKASSNENETDFNDNNDSVIVETAKTEPTEPLAQDGRDETGIEVINKQDYRIDGTKGKADVTEPRTQKTSEARRGKR